VFELPFIVFLLFIPMLLLILFALVVGAIGLVFGLLKFLLPVILIALLVNFFTRRSDRHDHDWTTHSTYRPTSSYSQHARKEIYDVKEEDVKDHQRMSDQDDQDEWSDF
jgi:energy-coupling factor transporter transmembrane protein EcfT